jgi:twitching motility protein PilT
MPFINVSSQTEDTQPAISAGATPVSLPGVTDTSIPTVQAPSEPIIATPVAVPLTNEPATLVAPVVEDVAAETIVPVPVEAVPLPAEVAAPASPIEAAQAEINVVENTAAASAVADLATEAGEVVSFTSTADADDPDKPSDTSLPKIKVTEGTEIKAEQGGIREIVGPGFDDESSTVPAEAKDKEIDKKESETPEVDEMQPNDIDVKATMSTDAEEAANIDPIATAVPAEPLDVASVLPAVAPVNAELSALAADLTMSTPTPEVNEPVSQTADTINLNSELDLPTKTYTLTELLGEAMAMRASDLHLSVGYRAMARVDGKLSAIKSNIFDHEMIKAMVKEVIGDRDVGDLESILDYDLAYKLADGSARFRVNIFRQQDSLAMVFRLIPSQIQSIEALKLPPIVKEFTKFSQGLVLFTGPTGSGKSTTIASLLNLINMSEPKHIVTIEDPVEYVYPKGVALVDQRQIFNDTESWSAALRSVLRQDPDIVLIGEMRDLETISSAIRVAETGHLVFATLHTNTAAQSIDRIIDVFPEGQQAQVRTQLASVLQAVVSQRLVPITGGGRRAAAEVLIATAAVRNAIRDDKVYQIDNMIQTSAELGMITMEKSLVGLVREGLISIDQAQMYSNKPADILTLLGQNK